MNVYEKGNAMAKIVIIGEAPGRDEDACGVPFIGAAGKLLDEILHRVGLTYESLLFTNVVHYWPAKKRKGSNTPTIAEIKDGIPRLKALMKQVKPMAIICVGQTPSTAMQLMMEELPNKIGKLAGTSQTIKTKYSDDVKVIYTWHPAAALPHRRPELKEEIVKHLSSYRSTFESITGKRIIQRG